MNLPKPNERTAGFARLRERWTTSARARGATLGFSLGLVGAYLLVQFGLDEILNVPAEMVLIPGTLLGAALGGLGVIGPIVALDVVLGIAFLVITNTPIMGRLARQWVRADAVPSSADAIVVLSAAVNSEGNLNTEGLQRLLTGLELYQRGVAPRVFTTEVEVRFGRSVRTSAADQERLVTLAGARQAWTSLTDVANTHDEALRTSARLAPGPRTVVVVTSPMHTRRACETFEGVGLRVVCVPSREHGRVTWHPLHGPDRLASFRDYLYERLGMVKYRFKGWVKD